MLHCNTLQHTATHCNALQHAAKLIDNHTFTVFLPLSNLFVMQSVAVCCSELHCHTLQHSATLCNTIIDKYWFAVFVSLSQRLCVAEGCSVMKSVALQHTATHCDKLRHTAPHSLMNTLLLSFYLFQKDFV